MDRLHKNEYARQWRIRHHDEVIRAERERRRLNPGRYRGYNRKNYVKNKAKILAYQREWAKKNHEKTSSYKRKYCKANHDDIREYQRIFSLAFPEKILARVKQYQERHRELVNLRSRDYRRNNPGKRRATVRKAEAKMLRLNLGCRIKKALRNRILQALKTNSKSKSALVLLGCSIPDFRMYLESLWETGMTWENYGKGEGRWNIEHMIPCALFDLTKPSHQQRCFHFSNQRPMWHIENMRKGAKLITSQYNLL